MFLTRKGATYYYRRPILKEIGEVAGFVCTAIGNG